MIDRLRLLVAAVLLATLLCGGPVAAARRPAQSAGESGYGSTGQARQRAARRRLQQPPGLNTYIPQGGQGSWESGIDVGIIMIHATLMKKGEIVGWSARNQGLQEYGTAVVNPATKTYEQLLDDCGIHDCKNAFCGAQTTTAWSQLLIVGGHGDENINWFRLYTHANRTLFSMQMPSGRWYPSVATLGDGKVRASCYVWESKGQVLVVGGVKDSGKAGYAHVDKPEVDNPTYVIFDPAAKSFGEDLDGMEEQLSASFPIHTYPQVTLLPDGGVAVSAGKLLVRYAQSEPGVFTKAFSYPDRPGPPWSYPQTGVGLPLPMAPPYSKLLFLASGGSSDDWADEDTPASAFAQVIDLTGGPDAVWLPAGPMPAPRVMGDGVILCDGTIGFFGGAEQGIAGWSKSSRQYEFRDGTSWYCEEKCTKAEGWHYEPALFDPATGKWSAKGSLAEAVRPRLYHSTAILTPDCKVMVSGSDVTNDHTAELFSPPYLSKGPRPTISEAPSFHYAGADLAIKYSSADPVQKAILIRTGTNTHSLAFDTRALWLAIASNAGGAMALKIPPNRNVLPPGMYMLVLLSSKGVPSPAKIISFP